MKHTIKWTWYVSEWKTTCLVYRKSSLKVSNFAITAYGVEQYRHLKSHNLLIFFFLSLLDFNILPPEIVRFSEDMSWLDSHFTWRKEDFWVTFLSEEPSASSYSKVFLVTELDKTFCQAPGHFSKIYSIMGEAYFSVLRCQHFHKRFKGGVAKMCFTNGSDVFHGSFSPVPICNLCTRL